MRITVLDKRSIKVRHSSMSKVYKLPTNSMEEVHKEKGGAPVVLLHSASITCKAEINYAETTLV
jgi:hypothetical protein